jgi:AhpD family alkylhydroperoxidase
MSEKKVFQKRIFSPDSFLKFFAEAMDRVGELRSARREGLLDQAFLERIMLAVTQVNGCRYCSYAHSKAAMAAGIPADQVRELLEGNLNTAPEDELHALFYAQHFAESKGAPEPEMTRRLQEVYGAQKAGGIEAAIRMITMGNLLGNTFDALLARLKGENAPGSSIGKEIATIFLIPFSPFYLLGRKFLIRR